MIILIIAGKIHRQEKVVGLFEGPEHPWRTATGFKKLEETHAEPKEGGTTENAPLKESDNTT